MARFFPSTDRETALFGTKLIDETNESMPVLLVQRGVGAHRYTKIEMVSISLIHQKCISCSMILIWRIFKFFNSFYNMLIGNIVPFLFYYVIHIELSIPFAKLESKG